MMNELVLLLQIGVISITAFAALRLGQNALVAFSVLQMVLANLFVLKQTSLFGMHATSADAFVVGSLLGFNLLQECYGKAVAKKMIVTTFVLLVFYAVSSYIHLLFVPSGLDSTQVHFSALLGTAPWLVGGSIVIFMIAQIVDFLMYGFLQRVWPKGWLIIRNYLALGATEVVDTILFTLFLFWLGITTQPGEVGIVSFIVKMGITLIATPMITFFLHCHRTIERKK